jgi:hypothetical protein
MTAFLPFLPPAHLGGFVMALFVGTIFYPVISVSKRHRIGMTTARILAIPVAVILFVVLIRNFYTSDPYAGESYFFSVYSISDAAGQLARDAGICRVSPQARTIIVKELVCVISLFFFLVVKRGILGLTTTTSV